MADRDQLGHVTEEDKRRMRVLGHDLSQLEPTEPVTGNALKRLVDWVNDRRAELGITPLEHDSDDDRRPEEGLHERARALGMVKRRH